MIIKLSVQKKVHLLLDVRVVISDRTHTLTWVTCQGIREASKFYKTPRSKRKPIDDNITIAHLFATPLCDTETQWNPTQWIIFPYPVEIKPPRYTANILILPGHFYASPVTVRCDFYIPSVFLQTNQKIIIKIKRWEISQPSDG